MLSILLVLVFTKLAFDTGSRYAAWRKVALSRFVRKDEAAQDCVRTSGRLQERGHVQIYVIVEAHCHFFVVCTYCIVLCCYN